MHPITARTPLRIARPSDDLEALLPFYCEGLGLRVLGSFVASWNPYWDRHGLTYEDPDGYRVVLQNEAWEPG